MKHWKNITKYYKKTLKAAPAKTYFMLKKVKLLGHIIENKKIKPLTSRIEGFQKLEPSNSMKSLQRYLGTINFLAKYVYGMQPILQPLYKLLHKETEYQNTRKQFQTLVNHFTSLLMLSTPESEQHYCNNTQQKIK